MKKALYSIFCLAITPMLIILLLSEAASGSTSDIASLLEKKGPKAKETVTKPTIVRSAELPRLPVSSKQSEFLLDHPRLSMVLARTYDPALDLYKISARPDGLMHVKDPAGLEGDMELIGSGPGRRVYFIDGHFDFLNMRFRGNMALNILYTGQAGAAFPAVNVITTSYVKVHSSFVGFFAKLMTLMFPKKVDERIGRFANAVRVVAVAVHNDPAGAYGKLAASGEVSPGELKEFARMFL